MIGVRELGTGIGEAHGERIIERVDRVGDRSEGAPNLGPGRSTVGEIARLPGGRIWAEIASKEGSTCRFVLPSVAPIPDQV